MADIGITSELAYFAGGVLTGVGGSWLTLRITRTNRVNGSGTATDQSGARAKGDIVGRDKRG